VAKPPPATIADVVRTSISSAVDRLDANEPALWTERDPDEAVHQARVATRRLRSDLRTLRAFVDEEWARHLRAEMRWLGAELGAVRDVEVLRERLSSHAGLLPDPHVEAARAAVMRLEADHSTARADLLLALRSERYAQLLHTLHDSAANPRLTADAERPASAALPEAVWPTWTKLRRAVDELETTPSDAALHGVRIRAKRCRYACELASTVIRRRARELATVVTRVQDVLGEHQDAVVAGVWIAKAAPECSVAEAYALGMLAETERGFAADARAAFPAAWRAARRPALRSWL
jgi:CHAD domain-containing protein